MRAETARRGAPLHVAHWLVLAMSLAVTIAAWFLASRQHQARIHADFERQAAQTVELVHERMALYENALWGGVAAIAANGGAIDHATWHVFAESLQIDGRYPGIDGIGYIEHVPSDELATYIEQQRQQRPGFTIHPERRDAPEHWPITSIVPVETNREAVGLDIAHEANRYAAAKAARDRGTAQITGPIVLVQDREKTAGFLFYAPFYADGHFIGLVYAPFVVEHLLAGALRKESRAIGLRLSDGTDILHDELVTDEADFDPDPLFKSTTQLELYGRTWTFEQWASKTFRARAVSNQPLTILLAGIVIDLFLLGFFVVLARRNAQLADIAERLDAQAQALSTSNTQLEQFAFVASHDLKEPLRMVNSYSTVLAERLGDEALDPTSHLALGYIVEGSDRMQTLIRDLLAFSRAGREDAEHEAVDLGAVLGDVRSDLAAVIEERAAILDVGELPTVWGLRSAIHQLFLNLVSNGLKFNRSEPPEVTVTATEEPNGWAIAVVDNGVGIDEADHDKIFEPFKRLHLRQEFEGNGIGLALCARICELHDASLSLCSSPGGGSTFTVYFPRTE